MADKHTTLQVDLEDGPGFILGLRRGVNFHHLYQQVMDAVQRYRANAVTRTRDTDLA